MAVLEKRMLNPEVLKCHEDLITLDTYVQQGITMDNKFFIRNWPGMVPVMFDETAAVPMTLPVDEEMGSQVEEGPDVVWTGLDMYMCDPDVGRDIQVLTDAICGLRGGGGEGLQ